VGVSIVATVLARDTQHFWHQLAGFIQPFRQAEMTHYLAQTHLDPHSPVAMALFGKLLAQQARMLAFINAFALIMWGFILMLPLVSLLKKPAHITETIVSE
jgi:DHA2 family multidrug resistance protein